MEHIKILYEKAKIKEFMVIRENNYFYSSKDGIASIEKALVDYYFEINHNLFYEIKPFNMIFSELFHQINLSTLLKCAQLRNMRYEFAGILKRYDIPKKVRQELRL